MTVSELVTKLYALKVDDDTPVEVASDCYEEMIEYISDVYRCDPTANCKHCHTSHDHTQVTIMLSSRA